MRSLIAFIKKEMTDQLRSGRAMMLCLIFVLLGIMNPAIAKLTPWMLEIMADTLAESGMSVGAIEVDAMDSWVQFFKNIPIGLISFVLIQGGIFTKEYNSGTLVLSLTKGLERFKVVISKSSLLFVLWSAGYWLCFCITYAYNAYFWDNSVAKSLMLSVVCWWLFGIFVISLAVLFSTLLRSSTGVLLGIGGVALAMYMLGVIPKIGKYLPIYLTDGNSLIYGARAAEEYIAAIFITVAVSVVCLVISIPIFNKKQI
jgi:ABC-2 type transport system permease protein